MNSVEEYKLEIATELIKEGLTLEQIARVLKLLLELGSPVLMVIIKSYIS